MLNLQKAGLWCLGLGLMSSPALATTSVPLERPTRSPEREATAPAVASAQNRPATLNVQVRSIGPDIRNALAAAQDLMAQGDAEKALQTYDNILAREPLNIPALTGKAAALQKLNRASESRRHLEAALAAGGDGFVLQASMALLQAERDPKAAAAALPRPASGEQGSAYHAVMGQLRAMAGEHLQAAEHLNKALRQNPSSPILLWNYAVTLDHLDRRAEAIEHYRSALVVMAGHSGDEDTAQLQRSALARLRFLEAPQAGAETPSVATPVNKR